MPPEQKTPQAQAMEQDMLERLAIAAKELTIMGWSKGELHGQVDLSVDEIMGEQYVELLAAADKFKCDLCGQVFDIEDSVRIGKDMLVCSGCKETADSIDLSQS